MHQLRLFGPFRISRDDEALSLPVSKARSLLAYLVLFPRANCSRERLVDLLWPDAPPDRSHHRLSSLIYQIRHVLGAEWLITEDDQLHLNFANLWVDVIEFDRLVRRTDPAALTEAIALYTDDLLPDLYDDWLTVPRLERRECYITALETLVSLYERQNDLTSALRYARQVVMTEPLREENQQTYLRLLYRLGRRNEALAHYDALCRLLQQELAVAPLPETQAIVETIRRDASLARPLATSPDQRLDQSTPGLCLESEMAEQQGGSEFFAALARLDLGYLLVRQNRAADALPVLERAAAVFEACQAAQEWLRSRALLGLALWHTGERARAATIAAECWRTFLVSPPEGEEAQYTLWALWQLLETVGRPGDAHQVLAAAYITLQRHAALLDEPTSRRRFFEKAPLNHELAAAWLTYQAQTDYRTVALAHRDVPLGRRLTEADCVLVTWTLHAPEDDQVHNKCARRQAVLKRLLVEASVQDAAPTDDDLAQALGVSRRTVLRDMKALAQAGVALPTRKRKR
ncbi:MAG: BTAD domain-containing putative transcriptional regulator [Anaerolineae bacterium]